MPPQKAALEALPRQPALLIMDFDGVLTDNRVLVDQNGVEAVFCHRGDGLGLAMLRESGFPCLVISKERNPVVQARCTKLQIPCLQSVDDKLPALVSYCRDHDIDIANVVYVGNDLNDLECIEAVGCGVAVADAHPRVLRSADLILSTNGGFGAVRELCEFILERLGSG